MTETNGTPAPSIRIVIVDDHPAIVTGLSSMLSSQPGMRVVATLSSGASIQQLARELEPNLFLVDLRMPSLSGIECIRLLRFRFPAARMLVLSSYDMDEEIFAAVRAGATGYLTKSASQEEMIKAIRRVAAGKFFFSPEIARKLAIRSERSELTGREVEILKLVARGLTNRQIGSELQISENTVRNHVNSLLSKLEVQDRTEATVVGLKRGLVLLDEV